MMLLKILLLGIGFIFLASVETSQAQAQSGKCDARDNVIQLLAQKYKETPIAAGVTNTGGLVEVLTDPNSGTWTIIVTTPKGISCLVAAGEGWRNFNSIDLNPHT